MVRQRGTYLILGNTAVPTELCETLATVFSRVGAKWTIQIVLLLDDGPMRYSLLRELIGSVSQRMLTRSLRALESDGLVIRTAHPTPPRVDYELTALGHSLSVPVKELAAWIHNNSPALEASRNERKTRKASEDASL